MKQEDRLTRFSNPKAHGFSEDPHYVVGENQIIINRDSVWYEPIQRLAAYEDTGLSPAEVEELKHRAEFAEKVKVFTKSTVDYFTNQENTCAAREKWAENDLLNRYFQGCRIAYSDAKDKLKQIAEQYGKEDEKI